MKGSVHSVLSFVVWAVLENIAGRIAWVPLVIWQSSVLWYGGRIEFHPGGDTR
jgi:hypothetical protein